MLLCDLDFGAANVHTYLNEPIPTIGISDFLKSEDKPISDFVVGTQISNLFLLSCADDKFNGFDLDPVSKSRIMAQLYRLNFDYIVLDLSAGTHESTLDFFLLAETPIVALTPEPVSIENAYKFMKAAFYRRLKRFERQLELKTLISDLMENKERVGIKSPKDLLDAIELHADDNGQRLRDLMQTFSFHFVVNQARTHQDYQLGLSIQSVARRYFGVKSEYLGHLEYDNAVWQCLRKQTHVLLDAPQSQTYGLLFNIIRRLTQNREEPAKVA